MSYCEIPEFFSCRWVKAAKPHTCCECSAKIEKGEFHGVFTGKWDGEMSTYRQHIECEDACRWVRDVSRNSGWDDCLYWGQLRDDWNDLASSGDETLRHIMARIRYREMRGRKAPWPYRIDYSKLRDLESNRTRKWA